MEELEEMEEPEEPEGVGEWREWRNWISNKTYSLVNLSGTRVKIRIRIWRPSCRDAEVVKRAAFNIQGPRAVKNDEDK